MGTKDENSQNDAAAAIDSAVGYARGRYLVSSLDEMARAARAKVIARERILRYGAESIYDFTGSHCDFPLQEGDRGYALREFLCSVQVSDELNRLAIEHMGGHAEHASAVFNRTSAGIVAVILALTKPAEDLVVVTPGVPAHPSVKRAASLARVSLLEVFEPESIREALRKTQGSTVLITSVSSELAAMDDAAISDVVQAVQQAGRVAFVDDAYGARVRTLLMNQKPVLSCGADIAITSVQKAGLEGPRAGLLVGDASLIFRAASTGSELGLEARGPLMLAVLRALQRFQPDMLFGEVRAGNQLAYAMVEVFGEHRVKNTLLGPFVSEVDVLEQVSEHMNEKPDLAPVDASAALGMLLLQHHGMVTVNASGMPGARASLRLKTSENELNRFGGASSVQAAVQDALTHLIDLAASSAAMRSLLFGTSQFSLVEAIPSEWQETNP